MWKKRPAYLYEHVYIYIYIYVFEFMSKRGSNDEPGNKIGQKKHTYIKKRSELSKETYIYQKTPTNIKKGLTYTTRHLNVSKETYTHQKRPA